MWGEVFQRGLKNSNEMLTRAKRTGEANEFSMTKGNEFEMTIK